MWPTQRLDTEARHESEIAGSAAAILKLVQETVNREHFEHRFTVFPLFMAGIAMTSTLDKRHVQGLMQVLEQHSIGSNTRATRRLLEVVLERQDRGASMTSGRAAASGHVDWVAVSAEIGPQVVHFGF